MLKTISIQVSGKVQGVFYRQSTKEKASTLGIMGSVQNLRDGTVRIVASGNEKQLNDLIEWCKKGPPLAIVSSINITELPLENFNGFIILRISE